MCAILSYNHLARHAMFQDLRKSLFHAALVRGFGMCRMVEWGPDLFCGRRLDRHRSVGLSWQSPFGFAEQLAAPDSV